MATFVKVGHTIVNLDQVHLIQTERKVFTEEKDKKVVRVHFIAPSHTEYGDGKIAPESDYIDFDYATGQAQQFLDLIGTRIAGA